MGRNLVKFYKKVCKSYFSCFSRLAAALRKHEGLHRFPRNPIRVWLSKESEKLVARNTTNDT